MSLNTINNLMESGLLRQIIDMVPQQIFLKDSEARFLLVNKKMAELFGADMEDIIGKTDRDFWGKKEEVNYYNDIDKKIIETGEKFEIAEEPQTRKDGKQCINHVVKMPFTLPDGERGVLGIAIDITDIKDAERARFEIASGVLHDIGNAVVGFGSYINRIKRSLDQNATQNLENLTGFFTNRRTEMVNSFGEDKASAIIDLLSGMAVTQKMQHEELVNAVTQQTNITNHIQEILAIQRQYVAGHETEERKPVNLNKIINDCIAMVFDSLDKRNIALSISMPPEAPVIKGDHTKLMQVILNILKNSAEAIDMNAVEKNIHIRVYPKAEFMVVQIQDSGSGFDEATGSKLFERGFTTKPTGSGLGLYNCRKIIESHAGEFNISSEGAGKGAIATIQFKVSI
jgi:PAS domain S-box-containing protein